MSTQRPVIVGTHPVANYALAVQHRFREGAPKVVIRARGALVAKALNAANMAANMGLAARPTTARIGNELPEKKKGSQQHSVPFVELESAPPLDPSVAPPVMPASIAPPAQLIIIGGKPFPNYVAAIAMRLGMPGVTEVTLRARGDHTSVAVEAAMSAAELSIVQRPSLVRVGQESGPDGRVVSWIEIDLRAPAA